jgi:hypothetical protein
MSTDINDTVLFVGAGFSREAGLPTTGEITKRFFSTKNSISMSPELRERIDATLKSYWEIAFDYADGGLEPSLEDHFTMLDLSANAGHALGTELTPAKLRRIRRLSIHRIFEILDETYQDQALLRDFLGGIARNKGNSIISTNWDIVAELHLKAAGCGHNYVVPHVRRSEGSPALPVLKLHGSANWAYCDCCRRISAEPLRYGKELMHAWVFLEARDFDELGPAGDRIREEINDKHFMMGLRCSECGTALTARIATFSFDKALGYFQFQRVWEEALRKLIAAKNWIFIGYSLPDADFELRHMLKTAQLSGFSRDSRKISVVIDGNKEAISRYKRFFGGQIEEPYTGGFGAWLEQRENQIST